MDMTKLRGQFQTDATKEISGVEVPVGEGFFIRVARSGNKEAQRRWQLLTTAPEVSLAIRHDTLPEDKMEEIILDVQSHCILKGWRGLTENGQEVPYTPEKARELLRIPDFRALVRKASETQELFRTTQVEEAGEALGKS